MYNPRVVVCLVHTLCLFPPIIIQNALNAQRVSELVKTAETMGILDATSEKAKQTDIDEILGFLAALEKVSKEKIRFWARPGRT